MAPRFEPMVSFVQETSAPRHEIKISLIPSFVKPLLHGLVLNKDDALMAEFVFYHFVLTFIPFVLFATVPSLAPYSFLWLAFWIFTLQTSVLHIHYTTHVNIWKPEYRLLQRYVDWVMAPMVGLPFLFSVLRLIITFFQILER